MLSKTVDNSRIPIPVVFAAAVRFSPSSTLNTLAVISNPSSI
jgi:hypothetical protein